MRGARARNKHEICISQGTPRTIIVIVMCNVFLLRAGTYNTDAVTEKHSFRGRGGRPNRENPSVHDDYSNAYTYTYYNIAC